MKIFPVVSNEIRIELEDGTTFELHEGSEGITVKALSDVLVAKELNVSNASLIEVWRGQTVTLVAVNKGG